MSQVPDEPRTGSRPLVVLVGTPGAGKSTVGRLVAERLGVAFIDTDAEVEKARGASIAEIFVDHGEDSFRESERSAVAAALTRGGTVVSLGGGAVLSPQTRDLLKGHTVVWLKVSASRAASRIGLNIARPVLLGNVRSSLVVMLGERAPLYAEVSRSVVETDALTPQQVADSVVTLISEGS